MDQSLLKDVIGRIENIYNCLYQDKAGEAYGMIGGMVGILEQVIAMIDDDEMQGEIKDNLLEALQAMEDEDNIMLADIFRYEINERLLRYVVE